MAFTAQLFSQDTCGHLLQCGKSSNSQNRSAASAIALIISINHCPSLSIKPLPGQMLQNGFCTKGMRKERERRPWPKKVVGHLGFCEKPGFLFQGMGTALQTSNQFSHRTQGENITKFEA